jgi:hypothetical protein
MKLQVKFKLILSIFSNSSHLEWRAGLSDIIVKGTLPPCQVWFNLVQRFQRKGFKCDLLSKYAYA